MSVPFKVSAESKKPHLFPVANNLEWLRLIFALQVVITHAVGHLPTGITLPELISNFPGVPAFFFVSGFLIYSSYLNAPGKNYFLNRFFRLFPGLIVVTLGSGAFLIFALGWGFFFDNYKIFFIWFLSQITIGQAYNPEIFRSVGVGVINGSLWSVTTEIVFYLMVPLIAKLDKRSSFFLPILIFLSFFIYATGQLLFNNIIYRDKSIFDFLNLTPLVWGWMFGAGMLAVKYFHIIRRFMKFTPLLLIPLFVMIFWGQGVFFSASGNKLGLIYFISFSGLILWFAFWLPAVTLPFDFSYGSYIWHMPIINFLLVIDCPSLVVLFGLTFFMAALSWFFVEKPVLRLKTRSLRVI